MIMLLSASMPTQCAHLIGITAVCLPGTFLEVSYCLILDNLSGGWHLHYYSGLIIGEIEGLFDGHVSGGCCGVAGLSPLVFS